MMNNRIAHSVTFGTSGLLALFFAYHLVVSIPGAIKISAMYWSISKASTLSLVGLSIGGELVPLIIVLFVAYISFSFVKGYRSSTNKAKNAAVFLSVLMICMILLMISVSNSKEPFGLALLLQFVSILALLPFILYCREFRKAKNLNNQ